MQHFARYLARAKGSKTKMLAICQIKNKTPKTFFKKRKEGRHNKKNGTLEHIPWLSLPSTPASFSLLYLIGWHVPIIQNAREQ